MHSYKIVRPDSKGRVTLGHISDGISGFKMSIDKEHRVILEPMVEIPVREQWLFNNMPALCQLKQGLQDVAEGKLTKQDFSQYLSDEHDDE